jgi:DNA-binding MarR family transcriptional regulator
MAKKKLTPEQREALADVRRELRAVIELLQRKLAAS